MINGSPRGVKSSSRDYIAEMKNLLPEDWEYKIMDIGKENQPVPDFTKFSAMIFVFPLYVDAVPGVLLEWMERAAVSWSETGTGVSGIEDESPRVWAVVNSGFWEGSQNVPALEVVGNFCRRAGFSWEGGIGIGCGAMVQAFKTAPPEMRMKRLVYSALKEMVSVVKSRLGERGKAENPEIRVVQYGMPWLMYKIGGHVGWNSERRRNGLSRKEFFTRPYQTL